MPAPVLVVDVGATTSRFALARDGALDTVRAVANEEAADLETVLDAAIAASGARRPLACVLAVAGPVDGDRVALTNRRWSFSLRELRRALKLSRLVVVNDFVAVA